MKNIQTIAANILIQKFVILCSKYLWAYFFLICVNVFCFGTENIYKFMGSEPLFSINDLTPYKARVGINKVVAGFDELSFSNDLFIVNDVQTTAQLPDSMYGVKSNGHIKKLYKWYYYNTSDKLDSSTTEYYNSGNGYNNTIGHRTYNNEGRLVSFIIQQAIFLSNIGIVPTDSAIVVIYDEQNIFEGDKLVNKTLKYWPYRYWSGVQFYFETTNYEYDDAGKLLYKTREAKDPFDQINEYEYLYNEDGHLIYIVDLEDERLYRLYKYNYDSTDTLRITTEYFMRSLDLGDLDTISDWNEVNTYTETFDSLNRKTLELIHTHRFYDNEKKNYKVEYSYHPSNQLKNILYYQMTDTLSQTYSLLTRKLYNYTPDGDIMYYEQSFLDERTKTWEIAESHTYFYPDYITSYDNKIIETKPNELVVYPNPTSDIIYLQSFPPRCLKKQTKAQRDALQYSIFNIQGMKVKAGNIENNQINISELNNGIYILTVKKEEVIYYNRFIKR